MNLAEILGAAKPVHLEGLQVDRAGKRAGPATNARHGLRLGGKQGGGFENDAVHRFGDGSSQIHEIKAHHGAANNLAVAAGERTAGSRNQVMYRCANAHFKVARLGNVSGDGDDAAEQRLAQNNGAIQAVSRANVEDLNANISR